MKGRLVILLIALLSAGSSRAQPDALDPASSAPSDSIIARLRQNHITAESSTTDLSVIRQNILDTLPGDSCVKQEVLAILTLERLTRDATAPWPSMDAFVAAELGNCPLRSLHLTYLIGNFMLSEGKLDEGLSHLRYVFSHTSSVQLKVDCLNNIGVALIYMGQLDEAVIAFEELGRYGQYLSPLNWNNIAVAFLDAGDWQRAARFILRGLSEEDLSQNTMQLLQFNLLQKHTMAGEIPEGKALLDQMNLETLLQDGSDFLIDAESKRRCGAILLNFSLASDDIELFRAHAGQIAQWFNLDSTKTSQLPVFLQMLLPPLRFEIQSQLNLGLDQLWWLAMETRARERLASKNEPRRLVGEGFVNEERSQEGTSGVGMWGVLGGLAGLGLGIGLGWRMRKRSKRATEGRLQTTGMNPENMKGNDGSSLHPKGALSFQHRLMRSIAHLPESDQSTLIDLFRDQQRTLTEERIEKLQLLAARFQLTSTEARLVELMVLGYNSKDIARRMDISNSYVYNLRTEVRTKCKVPHNINLQNWLNASLAQGKMGH